MSAQRVLIVRVGAMGDVLHALPAVEALRRLRPEWTIDWVVDPRWAPLLVGDEGRSPVVSGVHLADTRLWSRAPVSRRTRKSILHLRRSLRTAGYDAVVDLQGTIRSAVIGSFARAAVFAGFSDPRERAAGWLYRQAFSRRGRHIVQQEASLLGEALGLTLEPSRSVQLPEHAAAAVQGGRILPGPAERKPFALLAPAAGWEAKQWGAERFGALARELGARGLDVLVNAASPVEAAAQAVVEASGGIATAVPCTVAELIALTRHAAVVVGGDSGPVHLAAALGTPVVALFGPTNPARNGPWGARVVRVLRDSSSVTSYKRAAAADAGLARITVDEVLEATLGAVLA